MPRLRSGAGIRSRSTRPPLAYSKAMFRAALAFVLSLGCAPAAHSASGEAQPTAAQIAQTLRTLSVDPDQSFRVRDLHLRRGDVSFYLNEGLLVFARPVNGRGIAAVFTTVGVEAGDAEMIVMPSQPAERASLASYTETPNLDEHFDLAVLFFEDATREEILRQVASEGERKDPDLAKSLEDKLNLLLRRQGAGIETYLVRGLLDAHPPEAGMFISTVVGRQLGPFQFLYQPHELEPVAIGRGISNAGGDAQRFQLWTAYRPRSLPPYQLPQPSISDYRLDVALNTELGMKATAQFTYRATASDGRVIPLNLSPLLTATAATVDGQPVELAQNPNSTSNDDRPVLIICPQPLNAAALYRVEVQFGGSVVKQVSANTYLVQDRNLWYPHIAPMRTMFDLQFQCPERFRLVATGEPIDEHVANGIRFVHRHTPTPEHLAGFNVGEYTSAETTSGAYHIETYADPLASKGNNKVPEDAAAIVAQYTKLWGALPIHSLAVTPVPGYFGQGFPGLIYLSNVSYMRAKERPQQLRGQTLDVFFSRFLLSHEIAHQWWGNLVTSADYRTAWLMEAIASYSALQRLEQQDGAAVLNDILGQYREDLLAVQDGKRTEVNGPVDFGTRLLDTAGERTWHVIIYEKGAWVLHMLRLRLGDAHFHQLQLAMLHNFTDKPIANDDFRRLAASFLPANDADPTLAKFFETWVYGTGIATLQTKRSGNTLTVIASGVDESFSVRLPLRCRESGDRDETRWQTVSSGETTIALRANERCQLPRPEDFLYVPK